MPNQELKNPWTTISSAEKYSNPWIKVTEYQVLNPAGGKGIYGKVHFKNKAIGIVPLDEHGNTWLVGQYRYPLSEWSWEIPEGGGPVEQTILHSAQRELKEETGLIAKNGHKSSERICLTQLVMKKDSFFWRRSLNKVRPKSKKRKPI